MVSRATKYHGDVALAYEGKRAGQVKWREEERALHAVLDDFPAGTRVLDCPVGTGRFIQYYEARGFEVVGLDISDDMLRQARAKITVPDQIMVWSGDIFRLAGGEYDVAVSIRIMNLIGDRMGEALRALMRASPMVVFNLRVWRPGTPYRHAQRMEDVERALLPGWRIAADDPIHQDDFRMITLCAG